MESAAIEVDGFDSEEAWGKTTKDTRFSFPWKRVSSPETSFQAVYTNDRVFFFFEVEDRDIVIVPGQEEKTVAGGDRVEIFFAADPEMKEYYCLEIDPTGKILDYKASFYRNFDDGWNLPGLRAASRKTSSGYTVEVSIPVEWFRKSCICDMQPGSRIIAGIYRGEFSRTDTGEIEQTWISWQDPGIEKPDFHIPSSLGFFVVHDLKSLY